MTTKNTFKALLDTHMGGTKLSRSETVSVRFDARLRYLADIAARTHRRTLSSYTEWAVASSLSSATVDGNGTTVEQAAALLWDPREVVRINRLAELNASLLTFEEQYLHKLMAQVLGALEFDGSEDEKANELQRNWSFFKKAAEKTLPFDEVLQVVLEGRDAKVTAETIDRRIESLRGEIDSLKDVRASLMDGKAAERAEAKGKK